MNDMENLTVYEKTCSDCIDGLYRAAYLVFVNTETAEKLVTKVCAAGVHRYGEMEDEDGIRFRLASDLYRLCKRRLRFGTPSVHTLPAPLQRLTATERLCCAIRFAAGLSSEEACRIVGMSEAGYSKKISEILKKSCKPVG